jgi:hypothetical protein
MPMRAIEAFVGLNKGFVFQQSTPHSFYKIACLSSNIDFKGISFFYTSLFSHFVALGYGFFSVEEGRCVEIVFAYGVSNSLGSQNQLTALLSLPECS